jgi:hypothetical protein
VQERRDRPELLQGWQMRLGGVREEPRPHDEPVLGHDHLEREQRLETLADAITVRSGSVKGGVARSR